MDQRHSRRRDGVEMEAARQDKARGHWPLDWTRCGFGTQMPADGMLHAYYAARRKGRLERKYGSEEEEMG